MGKRSKGLSKALSLILALAMVVTCMPSPIYAYDNDLSADTGSEERLLDDKDTVEVEEITEEKEITEKKGIIDDEAAYQAENDIADIGEFGNDLSGDSGAVTYTFNINFGQTEARSMLAMVNDFRTGPDTWVWKKGDKEKEYYTGLGTLQYDYDLEKTAMQRAAEIALYFEHERPNGNDCFSAYSNTNGYIGENIAAGYTTASAAFTGWQETDKYYDGQGHRRNMLKSNFAYIGIGHAIVNGTHFWVQEFRSISVDTVNKTALDSSTDVDIEIDPQLISKDTYKLDSNKVTVGVGKTATLPAVKGSVTIPDSWPSALTLPFKNAIVNWQTTAQDIVSISGNTVTGLKEGSATLTTTTANIPITVTVTDDGGEDNQSSKFDYILNHKTVYYDGTEENTYGDNFFNVEISGCTEKANGDQTEYFTTGSDITVTLSTQPKPSDVPDDSWDVPYHDIDRYDGYAKYWLASWQDGPKTINMVNNTFTIPAEDVKAFEADQTPLMLNIHTKEENTTLTFEQGICDKFSISYTTNYHYDISGQDISGLSENKVYIRKNADYQGLRVSLNEEDKETIKSVKLSDNKTSWTEITEATDAYGNSYWIIPRSMTTSPKYVSIETEEIPVVEDPVFTPAAGVYTTAQDIVISAGTEGADIYYTTDGTEPSKTSTRYTGPVRVGEGTILIKAIAVKDGMQDSNVVSGKYTVDTKAVPVTGVVVTPGAITLIKGDSYKFDAAVIPNNADDATLTWSTSDAGKATVNRSGLVKAISAGIAKITAMAAGNVSAFATVTVTEDKSKEKVLEETDEDTKSDIVGDLSGGKTSDLISTNEKDEKAVVITDSNGNVKETKLWVGGIEKEYTYTGKPIKPEPHVYDGTTRLTEKKDYTLTYKKNTEAGTATIAVKFKGDYKGDTKEVTFKINPAVIGRDVIVTATAQEADKAAKPKLTFIMKETGATVAAGKFTVDPAGSISIPEGQTKYITVTAKDIKNFAGSTPVPVKAAAKTKLLSNAKVVLGAKSYVYTGKAIKPSYTLKMDKADLTEGTDYFVSAIYNNTEPGKATIVFEGKGAYTGSKTETFTISKGMDLSDKDVQKENTIEVLLNGQKNPSVPYSKAGATPAVTVYINDVKLVEGTDYTVKFTGNKTITNDAGAEIKFKGKYKGSATATFSIVKQKLSNLCIVAEDMFTKDGTIDEAKLAKFKLKITDNGKALGKNDYDVEVVEKNAATGKAKLKITGKGCYAEDPVTVSYRVLRKENAISKAKAGTIEKVYTGSPVTLTAEDLAGKITLGGTELVPDKDFTILETSYSKNVNKGTAKVTIAGTGTRGGNKTISFKIVQRSADWKGSYADGGFNN